MCVKQGMGWADPLGNGPRPTIGEVIEAASLHYKSKFGRWPNFVRLSPDEAEHLGNRLNGLLIIGDARIGQSYRLMVGWSEEVKEI